MKTRSSYSPEVTSRARRVLVDVFAALGAHARWAMLVGGGVPGLLPERVVKNAPGHAGTTDADILLDPRGFSERDYETVAERLLERGYSYRKDRDGNDIKFSFEVQVEGTPVCVDFLAPAAGEAKGFRVPIQPGLHGRAARGAEISWLFPLEIDLEEELLQGGRFRCRIRVVDAPGFIVLKALAFRDRQAPKDAYDLWYVLTYSTDGPGAVAARLAPHRQDADVAAAIDVLQMAFADERAAGAVAVATFQESEGEHALRAAAQAYAVLRVFLTAWDGAIGRSRAGD